MGAPAWTGQIGDIASTTRAWAQREPLAEYAVIPEAGHASNLDNPEEFTAVLQVFLDRAIRPLELVDGPVTARSAARPSRTADLSLLVGSAARSPTARPPTRSPSPESPSPPTSGSWSSWARPTMTSASFPGPRRSTCSHLRHRQQDPHLRRGHPLLHGLADRPAHGRGRGRGARRPLHHGSTRGRVSNPNMILPGSSGAWWRCLRRPGLRRVLTPLEIGRRRRSRRPTDSRGGVLKEGSVATATCDADETLGSTTAPGQQSITRRWQQRAPPH